MRELPPFLRLIARKRLTFGARYVSELLYIHTKLMIVDDKRVIVSVI
jgi:phosphatidylserine/phosphatidylglycerophosphate/cardiolipin synthase-like enzyme